MSDLSVFNDPTLEAGFARDGMVIVPLLAADEIAHLRAVYDRYPGEHATPFSASILSLDLDYRRFVFDQVSSTVAARASALFRSYRIFSAGFLSKQPDPDGAMPMHQDLTLVAEGPRSGDHDLVPARRRGPGKRLRLRRAWKSRHQSATARGGNAVRVSGARVALARRVP